MRKEFQTTDAEHAALMEACRPVPLVALQCGMPRSSQERANDAWDALGRKRGFISASVEGSPKGDRFFTAEVCEPAKDVTP